MAERAPDPVDDPLLEALIELARSAERNAAERRASRRLTMVDRAKRGGQASMHPGEELRLRIVRRRVEDCRRRLIARVEAYPLTFRLNASPGEHDRWFAIEASLPVALAAIDGQLAELAAGILDLHDYPIRQAHCHWGPCDRPRRRHFGRRLLERFPLTQPPHRCQSCGYEAEPGTNLELDHLAELVWGGADAPYNLIRVCHVCHRAKEIYPDELPSIARILALLDYGIRGSRAA